MAFSDHGDTMLTGFPGNRVPGPNKQTYYGTKTTFDSGITKRLIKITYSVYTFTHNTHYGG